MSNKFMMKVDVNLKEIGGYFELETFKGNEYHTEALRLNSARNSLIYLMMAKKIKKIYIPYFLCNSVKKALIKQKYYFQEYHVDKNLRPIIDFTLSSNEYILIVNYFGQLSIGEIDNIVKKNKNVIIDNTQSFFSKNIDGACSFNSCRKFVGVSDGSYLYSDRKIDFNLERDRSSDRMVHILGRFETNASDYYRNFIENDKEMANNSLKEMSKITTNFLRGIDYGNVKNKRNENFEILYKHLNEFNELKVNKVSGPFCYPLYIDNGDEIRKELIKKKIYIPILWPEIFNKEGVSNIEKNLSQNIVHLPCDQRYGVEDMETIIREVKRCLN